MNKIKEAFDKEREFISNASHELMTPISILQTNMENLLIHPDTSEELQEKISRVMKTLNRLKKIVQSLLFISRIENDQYISSGKIKPAELIHEMTEELAPRLESKGISLVVEVDESVRLKNVNYDLVFQLIYNIVANAIRYNKENGRIKISDLSNSDKSYTLFIEDTGIGIPEKDLANIFDRFKKSAISTEEGYGLGLYIVKTIALHYHLQLEVESKDETGTRFALHFPNRLTEYQSN